MTRFQKLQLHANKMSNMELIPKNDTCSKYYQVSQIMPKFFHLVDCHGVPASCMFDSVCGSVSSIRVLNGDDSKLRRISSSELRRNVMLSLEKKVFYPHMAGADFLDSWRLKEYLDAMADKVNGHSNVMILFNESLYGETALEQPENYETLVTEYRKYYKKAAVDKTVIPGEECLKEIAELLNISLSVVTQLDSGGTFETLFNGKDGEDEDAYKIRATIYLSDSHYMAVLDEREFTDNAPSQAAQSSLLEEGLMCDCF